MQLVKTWLFGLLGLPSDESIAPPIDDFALPERLYHRYSPDPARSIVDGSSQAEDVMEWHQYGVQFLTDTLRPTEIDSSFNVKDHEGKKWECVFPRIPDEGQTDGIKKKQDVSGEKKKAKKQLRQWLESLHPLRNQALLHQSGWWTYEFAYQKHIRQFHIVTAEEQAGRRDGRKIDEFLLGRYVPSESVSRVEDGGGRYLVQTYVMGDVCILPNGSNRGSDRKVSVHFVCDSSIPTDIIRDIVELGTCSYIMTVATPRVCGLVSAAKPSGGPILCYPETIHHHPPPTTKQLLTEDESSHLDEADRKQHTRRQHNILKSVAGDIKGAPQFTRLVNELLSDLSDHLHEAPAVVQERKPVETGDDDSYDEAEEEDSLEKFTEL